MGLCIEPCSKKLVGDWARIGESVLGPFRWPRHPFLLARFGWRALQPADAFATRTFAERRTRALFAGNAAHSMVPLDRRPTAGAGLVLNLMAHVAGWVIPRGGAQSIANALAGHLRALGGEIVTGAASRR